MVSEQEYRSALSNVAARSGVSIQEVETSFRCCVKKSAASVAALFLGDSVIALNPRKVSIVLGVVAVAAAYGPRARKV